MTLNKNQILSSGIWKTPSTFEISVYSEMLDKNIPVQILFNQFKADREISEFAIRSVNTFIELNKSHLKWIQQELWKHCLICLETTSYDFDPTEADGQESEFEYNKKLFGIKSSEDAFQKSSAKIVAISNENFWNNVSQFFLEYSTVWDDSHVLSFSFVDGEPFGVD